MPAQIFIIDRRWTRLLQPCCVDRIEWKYKWMREPSGLSFYVDLFCELSKCMTWAWRSASPLPRCDRECLVSQGVCDARASACIASFAEPLWWISFGYSIVKWLFIASTVYLRTWDVSTTSHTNENDLMLMPDFAAIRCKCVPPPIIGHDIVA